MYSADKSSIQAWKKYNMRAKKLEKVRCSAPGKFFYFFFLHVLCLYTTLWVMTDLSVPTYMIKPGLQPPIYPFPHCLAVYTPRLLKFFLLLGLNFGFTPQAAPRLLDHLSAPTPAPFPFLLLSLPLRSILNILIRGLLPFHLLAVLLALSSHSGLAS